MKTKNIFLFSFLQIFCFTIIAQQPDLEPRFISGQILLESGETIDGKILFHEELQPDYVIYLGTNHELDSIALEKVSELKISVRSFKKVFYNEKPMLLEVYEAGRLMIGRTTQITTSEKVGEVNLHHAISDYYLAKGDLVKIIDPSEYPEVLYQFVNDKPNFVLAKQDLAYNIDNLKALVRAYNNQ